MENIDREINKLLIDKNFLKLKSIQNKSNLFEILAVSYKELWHSAFIKWLIAPNSNYGLGTFPLKRFIFTVMQLKSKNKPDISIANIESMTSLSEFKFETEKTIEDGCKIDIYGENNDMKIIIENKINAHESEEQTIKYYDQLKNVDEKIKLFVFLTPNENQYPQSEYFIRITYQDICDYVIIPCLDHPNLTNEGKYLLEQYLYNLTNPIKGGIIMALPNKELCESIYQSHKKVLEEIFLSVKGVTPDKGKVNKVTLEELKNEGFINTSYKLYKEYKGKKYDATFDDNNGELKIKYEGKLYDTPSPISNLICNYNTNGWVEFEVVDENGDGKGTLYDLREKYLENFSPENKII